MDCRTRGIRYAIHSFVLIWGVAGLVGQVPRRVQRRKGREWVFRVLTHGGGEWVEGRGHGSAHASLPAHRDP